MWIVIMFGAITVFSVVYALKKQKQIFFALPFAALFAYMVIKVAMVPMPFWETVQFIFSLK
ncbi:hypothetical protein LC040_15710 [Bacillus tianshenii]|nr:hypothetical protein LC040_15710 [Bacillus tianshenii]